MIKIVEKFLKLPKNKIICFYDFEATSVSRDADIISLGIVATKNGKIIKTFYCEFNDFDLDKCDEWVKTNIISNLKLSNFEKLDKKDKHNVKLLGSTSYISKHLKKWLSDFEEIEFWADFPIIDAPMLIDIIGEWKTKKIKGKIQKIGLPNHLKNIKYDQFFDLHTFFKIKGLDPDIDREKFCDSKDSFWEKNWEKHNALYDSYICYLCYNKLINTSWPQ
jgi:hypothetical protein